MQLTNYLILNITTHIPSINNVPQVMKLADYLKFDKTKHTTIIFGLVKKLTDFLMLVMTKHTPPFSFAE